MSTLYVVSTPIGNLEDVTPRAARTLATVDCVLAEDTRRTSVLMNHLGAHTPLVSLHRHNEGSRVTQVVDRLDRGEDLALVSDAGTPLVSDPGERLVAAVWDAGHRVVPIPGASAPISALVASGMPTDRFTFLGFVPRKGRERGEVLDRVADAQETVILFESPERLSALLLALEERCGSKRRIAVARELTKVHEEVFRGTLSEASRYYEGGARGEVTVVVEPVEPADGSKVDEQAGRALATALQAEGHSPSRVAKEIARRLGISRNAAYAIVHSQPDGEPQ